jgi:hypothetical protein
MGSTNYGKLTNVSFRFDASNASIASAAATYSVANASAGAPVAQTFETVVVGLNHNIIRISGGALGFPIL